MVRLSAAARAQVRSFYFDYGRLKRPAAIRVLRQAVTAAIERIAQRPDQGLPAPRPYPMIAEAGQFWIKEGRYWFAYQIATVPLIVAVFFETADIPGRMNDGRTS